MKIQSIAATVHRFHTRLPLVDRPGPSEARVICRIGADTGETGVGMTARFLPGGVAATIRHHVAPAILGMDALAREAVTARLQPLLSERGFATGVNLAALSAVDLALWDLAGKAAGMSVARLLGGFSDRAPVYVTFGFPAYEREELAAVARHLCDEGHTRFKMVVGHPSGLAEDAARVRAVRDAVGPKAAIAIDANEALHLDQAIRLVRMVAECDIAWFEDPVLNNDPRDLAHLRRATGVAVSAGQMDGHGRRFRQFAEHDALDIFMPNSLYNGGMTQTQQVAALAAVHERALSDAGGGGIYCLHHVTAYSHATLAELHVGTVQTETAMFLEPPRFEGDHAILPQAPGFGVSLNEDTLRETLLLDL